MSASAKPVVGEARLRVRYAETDKMGVVYHSNFIIWFEVGRVELMRQLGFVYSDMETNDDCHIAVVDVHCRYKAPARYDDEIVVRTRITAARESLVHFSYQIVRANDQALLAEGESTHIVVDSSFSRTKLPPKYLNAFGAAAGTPSVAPASRSNSNRKPA